MNPIEIIRIKIEWGEFLDHNCIDISIEEDGLHVINAFTVTSNTYYDIKGVCHKQYDLRTIPFKIKRVHGDFKMNYCQLESLENLPEVIEGNLYLQNNKLKSLEGLDKCKVLGNIKISNNELTTLKGCPEEIYGYLDCRCNHIKSMEFCPKKIGKSLILSQNDIDTLQWTPEYIEKSLVLDGNKIEMIDSNTKMTIKKNLVLTSNPISENSETLEIPFEIPETWKIDGQIVFKDIPNARRIRKEQKRKEYERKEKELKEKYEWDI